MSAPSLRADEFTAKVGVDVLYMVRALVIFDFQLFFGAPQRFYRLLLP